MKTFMLKADTTFEAEDIDDAFLKLAEYFQCLHDRSGWIISDECRAIFLSGKVDIQPVEIEVNEA